MAVRQPAPKELAAARQPAASPDPEVERVARLLEEYTEKWRTPERYGSHWDEYIVTLLPVLGVKLHTMPEGALMILYNRSGEEGDIFLIPPEDAKKVAEELVRMEREHGFVSHLLDGIWSKDVAWWFIALEALRRYGPLFGRDYGVPELTPKTGDVYRDFLEALYATRVYSAVAERAKWDAAAPWRGRKGPSIVKARKVRIPIEPPVPLAYDQELVEFGHNIVRVEMDELYSPYFYFLSNLGSVEGTVEFSYDRATDSDYLSVHDAAVLMYFERERRLLTRLARAVERRLKALEAFTGEALLAAEAAALLFG